MTLNLFIEIFDMVQDMRRKSQSNVFQAFDAFSNELVVKKD